jgi:Protein of unknown function (DUF3685)
MAQRGNEYWRRFGREQIDRELSRVERCLASTDISLIDRLFWQGRRRELRVAAWLIDRTLTPVAAEDRSLVWAPQPYPQTIEPVLDKLPATIGSLAASAPERLFALGQDDRVLTNLTGHPLEIDILQPLKFRQLLLAVSTQIQATLADLRSMSVDQLAMNQTEILLDIWQGSASRFFGRYYTLTVGDNALEVVSTLNLDRLAVGQQLLERVPCSSDLWRYLLWQTDITIDNQLHAHGSVPATEYVKDLATNATLQIANGVLYPFLNRFGELETVKEQFYRPQMLATRDIARFRNHLSWRYYLERQYYRPMAIFESRYQLLVCSSESNLSGSIQYRSIYAPRRQELSKLRGFPWLVTMALEFRDAVTPFATGATTFVGNVVVYVLTEIVGRGLGLVGKGILQGIGQAWQERPRS